MNHSQAPGPRAITSDCGGRKEARLSDIAALMAGIGAMLSALTAIGTLWITMRRGSDRESKRSAEVAIEITKDETVTPIERGDSA